MLSAVTLVELTLDVIEPPPDPSPASEARAVPNALLLSLLSDPESPEVATKNGQAVVSAEKSIASSRLKFRFSVGSPLPDVVKKTTGKLEVST